MSFEPWNYVEPEDRKDVVDDPNRKCKVNDPQSLITKILTGQSYEHDSDSLFTFRPGKTALVDKIGFNRIKQQKNLNLFGDRDGDGVKNIFDCQPRNKKKQGFIHDFAKRKGFGVSQATEENTAIRSSLTDQEYDLFKKQQAMAQKQKNWGKIWGMPAKQSMPLGKQNYSLFNSKKFDMRGKI